MFIHSKPTLVLATRNPLAEVWCPQFSRRTSASDIDHQSSRDQRLNVLSEARWQSELQFFLHGREVERGPFGW